MDIKVYDSFRKLKKINDNKINFLILGSRSSEQKYYGKTFFLDLYSSDFDKFQSAEYLIHHITKLTEEYSDIMADYRKHLIPRVLMGKKLHLCFGTEDVLSELGLLEAKTIEKVKKDIGYLSDGIGLNRVLKTGDSQLRLNDFVAIQKTEIDGIVRILRERHSLF